MWRLSTELRNQLLEAKQHVVAAKHGTTISYSSGTGVGGSDQILDTANGLAGFGVGDFVTIIGSTSNQLKTGQIVAVAAGALAVTGAGLVNEVAGLAAIIASASGGSMRGLFRNGVIRIFSGTQPTSADDAETGALLCEISLASGTFTPGGSANGINFGQTASGVIHKAVNEVWSGINSAGGVAGWFRLYANDRAAGASAVKVRMDGACATSGSQINLTTTTLVMGVTTTIDTVNLAMPAQ